MRKTLLLIPTLLIMGLIAIQAQITTPPASPSSSVKQVIGLTEVHVDYSRPSMKDRTIFSADGLVPFGKVWRTGANSVTKITFGDDVSVADKPLKGGEYAVLTKPDANTWDVHFYPYESSNWGSYVEKTPAAIVTVAPGKLSEAVETFTIGFDHLRNNSAHLVMTWENTKVALPLTFSVDKKVMEAIDRVMAGPSNNDYFRAATYYHEAGKDLNKALEWIKLATAGENPRYWQVRRKALILADLGKKAEAIAAAKQSWELAKAAGNDDYVRMNEKSLKDWGAM